MDSSAFDAARALLPAWLPWVSLVYVPLAGMLSWLVSSLGTAIAARPLRNAPWEPWPARARAAFPARTVGIYGMVFQPVMFGAVGSFMAGPLSVLPPAAMALAAGVAAILGALVTRASVERRVQGDGFLPVTWLRGQVIQVLVLAPHLVLALLASAAVPDFRAEPLRAAAVLAVFLPTFLFLAAGGGLSLAEAMGFTSPTSPRLTASMDRAAARVGNTARRTVVLRSPLANAFAFRLSGRVVLTEGALDAVDDEALDALCARQLAVLTLDARPALGRVATSLLVVAPWIAARTVVAAQGFPGLSLTVVAAMGLVVLVNRGARAAAARFDTAGRPYEGVPGAQARALESLFHANLTPLVPIGKGTPAMYDRLLAAGATLPYARPDPPPVGALREGLLVVALGAMLCSLAVVLAAGVATQGDAEGALLAVAATGGSGQTLAGLAYARSLHGDPQAAAVLYGAATAADTASVFAPANLAIVLAAQGRCGEASAAAREARSRWAASGMHPNSGRIAGRADDAVTRCLQRGGK